MKLRDPLGDAGAITQKNRKGDPLGNTCVTSLTGIGLTGIVIHGRIIRYRPFMTPMRIIKRNGFRNGRNT